MLKFMDNMDFNIFLVEKIQKYLKKCLILWGISILRGIFGVNGRDIRIIEAKLVKMDHTKPKGYLRDCDYSGINEKVDFKNEWKCRSKLFLNKKWKKFFYIWTNNFKHSRLVDFIIWIIRGRFVMNSWKNSDNNFYMMNGKKTSKLKVLGRR